MLITISILTMIVVVATLLPLTRIQHWIVRDLDFPRLQISSFAAVVLVSTLIFLNLTSIYSIVLAFANLTCLIWQLWWIFPYTPIWKSEVKKTVKFDSENEISILTSNVLTPNRNSKALIDLVNKHEPDILITLESDKWWQTQLAELETNMPYTVKCPLDNLYGMHLYSKLKLHDMEVSYLVEEHVPSIHATLELKSGTKVRAHFLHPSPPSPSENTRSTERDAELLIVAKSVKKNDQPVIVTGDLNDVAWSSTTRLFRKTSGLLDPRIGRGMFNTFNAKYLFLRWPLDHIFHSKHFTLHSIQRLPSIDSDHFPLLTSLVYSPSQACEQDGIERNPEDQERADEIINKNELNVNEVPS